MKFEPSVGKGQKFRNIYIYIYIYIKYQNKLMFLKGEGIISMEYCIPFKNTYNYFCIRKHHKLKFHI
jgi:hypothetical protein